MSRSAGAAAGSLRRDDVLVRSPEVDLRLEASGEVVVALPRGELVLDLCGLGLLEAFSRPRIVSEVVDELAARARGVADFVSLTSALHQLHAAGVLNTPDLQPKLGEAAAFAKPEVHVAMLGDQRRTHAFIDAIGVLVRPDDVVLDIGTGTGILALAAARAGARHVYAVEASSMAELAREVVRDNGYGDRITVISGWSTSIELPERASLLVTETIGNDAFEERIVSIVADAKKRLLLPDARIVPRVLRVLAAPFQMAPALRDELRFTPENLESFRSCYGFSFDALGRAAPSSGFSELFRPHRSSELRALGPSTLLAEVALDASHLPRDLVAEARLEIDRPGELDAVIVGFEAELAPGEIFTRAPTVHDPESNWALHARVLHQPRPVVVGDRVAIRYAYERGRARLAFVDDR